MKKLILSILLLLGVGFGITSIQHPFDIKNLHYNKLDDFLPSKDEDSQIRLGRMSVGDWNFLRGDGQIWDDSLWVNNRRGTYAYDENNNMIEEIVQDWENSEWVNDYIQTLIYDEKNNMIESLMLEWEDSDWVKGVRWTYTYDENNNRTEALRQFGENSEWVNHWKYTHAYDENNNMIEEIVQDWENSDWVNHRRRTYAYDENNNQIEYLYQNWENSDWVNSGRNIYSYSDNNNMIDQLSQDWNASEQQFINDFLFTYEYDENNNQIEWLINNDNDNQWELYSKVIFTYDQNNNLIEQYIYLWENSEWVNDRRFTFAYDDDNNQIEYLYQNWENSEWVNHWRYTYIYCEQGTECYPFDSFGNCIATGDNLDENGLDCSGECSGDNSTCIGDVDGTGDISIMDIILIINCVLDSNCFDIYISIVVDTNSDGIVDILDISNVIDSIVTIPAYPDDPPQEYNFADSLVVTIIADSISIQANGVFAGIQMTLHHDDDFEIELTNDALLADYITIEDTTTFIVIYPISSQIASYSGQFEVINISAAVDSNYIQIILQSSGCLYQPACNYDVNAIIDDGSCIFAEGYYDCDGNCLISGDADENGECDGELSIDENIIPDHYSISSIFPNPFNPTTTISFSIPQSGMVSLKVYEIAGKLTSTLTDEYMNAGYYNINWNASSFSSGVYLIRMDSGDFTQTQKVVLVQ